MTRHFVRFGALRLLLPSRPRRARHHEKQTRPICAMIRRAKLRRRVQNPSSHSLRRREIDNHFHRMRVRFRQRETAYSRVRPLKMPRRTCNAM